MIEYRGLALLLRPTLTRVLHNPSHAAHKVSSKQSLRRRSANLVSTEMGRDGLARVHSAEESTPCEDRT